VDHAPTTSAEAQLIGRAREKESDIIEQADFIGNLILRGGAQDSEAERM
jgi:hypothetical protein